MSNNIEKHLKQIEQAIEGSKILTRNDIVALNHKDTHFDKISQIIANIRQELDAQAREQEQTD